MIIAMRYDAVVVGGGAAGLSAALVLGRALRRVAVVDGGSPRNAGKAAAIAINADLVRDDAERALPMGARRRRGRG